MPEVLLDLIRNTGWDNTFLELLPSLQGLHGLKYQTMSVNIALSTLYQLAIHCIEKLTEKSPFKYLYVYSSYSKESSEKSPLM